MTHPDPVAFTIFGYDIMWYGTLIACGAALACFIAYKRAPIHGIVPEATIDATIWALPIGIIGARIYYVVFSYADYAGDFRRMIDIRGGGLAIHGGLIAGIITMLVFSKVRKIDPVAMLDLFIPSVALAQAIGRWGNFFNGEAHGGPTDLPWAILVGGERVHPTFLYESIWCLIIFAVLIHLDRKGTFRGQIFCTYLIMYSAERFFVEGLRTDSLMIGPLRQAQVISIALLVLGIAGMVFFEKRNMPGGKSLGER